MEQLITTLIYMHAFFGGIGLITGMISIFVKKGGFNHKRTGKIFSYSMIISSLISLFVARMPKHENLFLFLIGIFTIYLILAGNRALTLKSNIKDKADWIDKVISGTMLLVSIGMLILGILGMVLGLLLRSPISAISIGVLWLLIIENLIGAVKPVTLDWMPGSQLQTIAQGGTPLLEYQHSLILGTSYVIVGALLAGVLFSRRDVAN